jgi:hypothetical protein
VHPDKFAALATLLTVHVARLAVSVLEPKIVLLSVGTAIAMAANTASSRKVVRESIVNFFKETKEFIVISKLVTNSSLNHWNLRGKTYHSL